MADPEADEELWYDLPVLAGRLIRLEPLAMAHAPGYLAAAGSGEAAAEVFRWLSPPGGALGQPVTVEDAAGQIAAALAGRENRARLPSAPPGGLSQRNTSAAASPLPAAAR